MPILSKIFLVIPLPLPASLLLWVLQYSHFLEQFTSKGAEEKILKMFRAEEATGRRSCTVSWGKCIQSILIGYQGNGTERKLEEPVILRPCWDSRTLSWRPCVCFVCLLSFPQLFRVGVHLHPEWTVYCPVALGEKSLVVTLLLSVSSVAPLLQTHWGKGVSFGVLPAFCPFWSSEWMSAEKSLQVGVDSSCVCSSQGCCTLMLVHFCPFTVCYKLLAEFFLF